MAFENTIHGGAAPSLTTSVYYTGSDTLLEGYALCYDFNAYDVNSENVALTSINVGEEAYADARRVLVEKPSEQNKVHFAGVVAAQSDGVTGPGWVTIHRPGSVCNAYVYSDCDSENPTAGTEGAGTGCGDLVNVVVGQYYMQDFGMPGCGAALILQDVSRSSTAGLIMVELMTGAPSGGINIVGTTTSIENAVACTTATAISNALGYVPAFCGTYVLTDSSMTGMILSFNIAQADGRWAGQKLAIFTSTFITNGASIMISGYRGNFLTDIDGGSAVLVLTSVSYEISAAGEYLILEFDGLNWGYVGGHENVLSV